MYPSVIYGVLDGPLVKAGIAHAYSVTIVASVKLSISRGQGAMVGKGLNRCPAAHIEDSTCLWTSQLCDRAELEASAAKLYRLVFERALLNEAPHGAQGEYVIENGEFTFADVVKQYTIILHAQGKSARAEPEAFTPTEIQTIPQVRD